MPPPLENTLWVLLCVLMTFSNSSNQHKLKMAYSRDLADMDCHGLSWTIMDYHGLS